jgi:hypothetical protein
MYKWRHLVENRRLEEWQRIASFCAFIHLSVALRPRGYRALARRPRRRRSVLPPQALLIKVDAFRPASMIMELRINAAAYLRRRSYLDDKPILETTPTRLEQTKPSFWDEPSAFDRGAIPHPINQSRRTGGPISAYRQA